MNQEIFRYLTDAKAQGFSDSDLRDALINSGWPEDQVTAAFTELGQNTKTDSQTTVGPVFPVSSLASTSASSSKKFTSVIFWLLVVMLLVVFIVLIYLKFILVTPDRLLVNSLEKLRNLNSVYLEAKIVRSSTDPALSFALGLHRDPKIFSQIGFKLDHLGTTSAQSLVVNSVISQDEIYFMPVYSKLSGIEDRLTKINPKFLALKTYHLALPALRGQTWIRSNLPPISQKAEVELNEVWQKMFASLSIRRVEKVNIAGTQFSHLVLGLKKEKLLDLIRTLPSLNLGFDHSQTSNLVKIVESIAVWDYDLATILIDSQSGYLSSVNLTLPRISSSTFEKVTSTDDDLRDYVWNYLFEHLPGDPPLSLNLTLSRYNEVPPAAKPLEFIEFDPIWQQAKTDNLPSLLYQL